MDRYPYYKPPRGWSSKASLGWMRIWRPWRKWQQRRDYRIDRIDVQGLDRVRAAIDRGEGVLITPNHAGHADCYLLFEALERLPLAPQVMTAWQVFALLPRLQCLVYRHHGCFSINRESNDLTAFRWSVRTLQNSSAPLVIFPEGEVYHLNDLVTEFRDGTMAIAASAARRSARPIACFPCALKYFYVGDPTAQLVAVAEQLERQLGVTPPRESELASRVERILAATMRWRASQYATAADRARIDELPLAQRPQALAAALLDELELRLNVAGSSDFLPERIKAIRQRIVEQMPSTDAAQRRSLVADLETAFVAVQLYSYRPGYLAAHPTIERIAETIDKLEEDVLGLRTANIRGRRRAVIAFGEPMMVDGSTSRQDIPRLNERLRSAVQSLVDALEARRQTPGGIATPAEFARQEQPLADDADRIAAR
jgi:hypothetical protein